MWWQKYSRVAIVIDGIDVPDIGSKGLPRAAKISPVTVIPNLTLVNFVFVV